MHKINKVELKSLISELQDTLSPTTTGVAADVVFDSDDGSIHAVYFTPSCYISPKMPKRIDETETKRVLFIANPDTVSHGIDLNEKHFSFSQAGIQKLVEEVFA